MNMTCLYVLLVFMSVVNQRQSTLPLYLNCFLAVEPTTYSLKAEFALHIFPWGTVVNIILSHGDHMMPYCQLFTLLSYPFLSNFCFEA